MRISDVRTGAGIAPQPPVKDIALTSLCAKDLDLTAIPFSDFDSADAMSKALAVRIAAGLRDAIAASGRAILGLSGGRSPIDLFEALSTVALDWEKVEITPVDDRMVTHDHPASNYGLICRHMRKNLAAAARFVPLSAGPVTRFADIMVLGMGLDGHTASLFPEGRGMAAARDRDAGPAVVAVCPEPLPPEAPFERLTHNLPAILGAGTLMLAIQGAAKREVLIKAALNGLPVAAVIDRRPVEYYWSP